MSDNETYLAIARAWNVGAGKAQPATSSHEAYALAAQAWKQGGETMLPDVNANMKAIAKKWNLETPEPQKQLPGKVEAQITTSEALWHLAAAKLLTTDVIKNPITGTEYRFRSAAEVGQKYAEDVMNKAYAKHGIDIPRERPTPEKLQAKVARTEEKFAALLGPRFGTLPSPDKITAHIHDETVKQVKALYTQPIGKFEKPNQAEEILAAQLELMVGHHDAREIAERLHDMVFAQSADIVLTNQQAAFSRIAPAFNERYADLKIEKPDVFYFAPWLTTEVMFRAAQQKDIENTTWAMTPTKLIVQRVLVDSEKEDSRAIDLKLINNPEATNGVLSSAGTPPYVDYLKTKGTRVLQPFVNKLVGSDLGGIVVLRQMQAMGDPLVLAVQDAKATNQAIIKLAKMNQDAEIIAKMVNETIMDSDNVLRPPIRPAMIRHMLPPLALDRSLSRTASGDVNYRQAQLIIEQELAKQEEVLHQIQKGVAREIIQGPQNIPWKEAEARAITVFHHPLEKTKKRKATLEGQVKDVKEILNKKDDETKLKCPSCGANSGGSACAYCGTNLL